AWAFGDGATASGATATHTYTAPGTYNATLTVTDNLGATGSAGVTITATTDPAVIAAPSALTASAASSTVTLKWNDNSSNETGFYIERQTSGKGATFSRIAQVGANVKTWSQTAARGS